MLYQNIIDTKASDLLIPNTVFYSIYLHNIEKVLQMEFYFNELLVIPLSYTFTFSYRIFERQGDSY